MTIVTPRRYIYADFVCYALKVAEELQDSEQKSFKEAFERKENK